MTKKIGGGGVRTEGQPGRRFWWEKKKGVVCVCVGGWVWEKGFAAKLLHVGQRGKGYASHGSSASDRHH